MYVFMCDRLVVASKLHPTDVVLSLLDYLLPSRPIIVFSAYKEVSYKFILVHWRNLKDTLIRQYGTVRYNEYSHLCRCTVWCGYKRILKSTA